MAKRKKKKKSDDNPLVRELDAIKRLLAVFLLKSGASHADVAKALGVDRTVVARMFPARQIRPFKK
jgi:DNA invertase Pin-like site-specific DNA recombinase